MPRSSYLALASCFVTACYDPDYPTIVGSETSGTAASIASATDPGMDATSSSTGGAIPGVSTSTSDAPPMDDTSTGDRIEGTTSTSTATGDETEGEGSTTEDGCSGDVALGCPCHTADRVVCEGAAQERRLVCTDGAWTQDVDCPTTHNCDQSDGECRSVLPECDGQAPGHTFCEGANVLRTCGEDQVTASSFTCSQICQGGECVADSSCESGNPVLGCPCDEAGALACNGPGQKLRLMCTGGEWQINGAPCGAADNCDQRDGTCRPIVPECSGQSAGHTFCEGLDVLRQCNEDLVAASSDVCAGICQQGTTAACLTPYCGDGKLETVIDEECDDGNDVVADGCEPSTCVESRVVDIAVGAQHSCALLRGGHVRCWGNNEYNQLGLGHGEFVGDDLPYELGPATLGGTATAIATGFNHTCALLSNQTIRCWGRNNVGQLGLGNANPQLDRTPAQLGPVNVGGNVAAIAAGGNRTCAILANGALRCWGDNSDGGLGLASTASFAAQTPNQYGPVTLGGTATAVALGASHVCALLTGGTVRCWGYNGDGELGLGSVTAANLYVGDSETPGSLGAAGLVALPSGRTAVEITAGSSHTCVRLSDGSAQCWGYNPYGQLGLAHTNAVGDDESPAGFGAVLLGGRAISRIVAGVSHTCAVTSEGLVCWGRNNSAQLGYADIDPRISPATLPAVGFGSGRTVERVGASGHTCVLLDDDDVRCWGLNAAGQLGMGFVSSGTVNYVGGTGTTTPDRLDAIEVFP